MDKVTAQKRIDAIEDAIAKGVLIVKFEGKEVTYRSMQDMFRVRDFLLKQLGYKVGYRSIGVYNRGTR